LADISTQEATNVLLDGLNDDKKEGWFYVDIAEGLSKSKDKSIREALIRRMSKVPLGLAGLEGYYALAVIKSGNMGEYFNHEDEALRKGSLLIFIDALADLGGPYKLDEIREFHMPECSESLIKVAKERPNPYNLFAIKEAEGAISHLKEEIEKGELKVDDRLSEILSYEERLKEIHTLFASPDIFDLLIREMKQDEDKTARNFSILLLEDINNPKAIPDLILAFKEAKKDDWTRFNLIRVLGKFKAKEVVDIFCESITSNIDMKKRAKKRKRGINLF
jgi:hypothetical protein